MKNKMKEKFLISIFLLLVFLIQQFIIINPITSNSLKDEHNDSFITQDKNPNPIFDYSIEYNAEFTKIVSILTVELQSNKKDALISNDLTYQYNGNDSVHYINHIINVETILTDSRVSSFTVFDAYGPLLFSWLAYSSFDLLNITTRTPLLTNDYYSFSVSYVLENAVLDNMEISGNYILQMSYTHHEYCEQFSCVVALPAKYDLYNNSLVPALDPEPTYSSIDQTRFEWDYYNVLESSTSNWVVRFKPYQDNFSTNHEIPPFIWILMVVLFIVGGGIGSITVYFVLRSKINVEKSEIVDSLLSLPEKEIIKIIKDEGRVTTQSKICSVSGFSKAKVSYYINELEKKEIIARERFGRQNRIRLIDDSID